MTAYETYWQVIEVSPARHRPQHHTYMVAAAALRILHQVTAPYQHTHQVIAAERRRCDVGVAVRLVLGGLQDPGEPVVVHVWRIRRTPAT